MKKTIVMLTALCVSSALWGCNSQSNSSNSSGPSPKNDTQARLGWTLKYQAKCAEGVDESNCLGAYGFSILTNGDFEVGAAPNGEPKRGSLTQEEMNALTAELKNSLAQTRLGPEQHEAAEASEIEDTLTLTRGSGNPETLVRTSGSELFFQTTNLNEAKSLLTIVKTLVKKYYNGTLPEGCKEGLAAFEALVNPLMACATDADCAYFDASSFEALSLVATASQELVTDDCTLAKPLVVGNDKAVKTNKAKLAESLEKMRTSCGESFNRTGCDQTSVVIAGGSAACEQGVCKVRPIR